MNTRVSIRAGVGDNPTVRSQMKKLICAVTILTVSSTSQHAAAEIVQYAYTGEISSITLNQNNVLGDLQIGDPFDGIFEFDLSVPDVFPDNPTTGSYDQDGLMTVNLPAISLDYSGHLFVFVFNDGLSGDRFAIVADNSFDDFNVSSFGVTLTDSTASAFDSDALPSLLQLLDFDGREFKLIGSRLSTGDSFSMTGVITSLTIVPTPGTVVVALALFGGAGLRRRRRRSVRGLTAARHQSNGCVVRESYGL